MREVILKIEELKKRAPHDWAERIASTMGKKTVSIYAYANGTRGARRGYQVVVLKHLKKMVNEFEKEAEKLIA